MKKSLSNKYLIYSLLILVGLLLGRLIFHTPRAEISQTNEAISEKEDVWTCAMHPHIRMDKPGKCPICAMDLIPLVSNHVTGDADAIHLSREAASLANVVTSVVSSQKPVKEVRLYGKVQADERLLQSQVAHIPGRIEKLFVNFTGESVSKGQKLVSIYSPELITAQQELLEAIKIKDLQPEIYVAAKEKLRLWKLTNQQIATIENSGQVKQEFDILSNTTGTILTRRINPGDYVPAGTVLFDVADLSKVWLLFDAYESDLPFLEVGDHLSFTIQALPGTKFNGKISFIDPVIDPVTRVAKVRVETGNASGKLKPEMFATGIVKANLAEYQNKMVIPRSAVLWTGRRAIVYVKQTETDEPVFKMHEIELGPKLGNSYVVISGLSDGEEIVTQGTFSVDAAAQLAGKPSMMSMETGEITTAQFEVSGLCEMCKERIEQAAKSVRDVSVANWNQETGMLKVSFNAAKTSADEIQQVIAGVGHDTPNYKAKDEVYDRLPDCCKYERSRDAAIMDVHEH
ncbi:MAG: efflux RND transporter periplasmic adaptor subunit [Bacteroidales bacterium]|nr:efflux RND transporter periplasmic adaptor subunit [Bacteroidales bacterium]